MNKLVKIVISFGKQYLPLKISKEDQAFLVVFIIVLFISICLTYYASEFLK
jgi:hypothetical protein